LVLASLVSERVLFVTTGMIWNSKIPVASSVGTERVLLICYYVLSASTNWTCVAMTTFKAWCVPQSSFLLVKTGIVG
jgi:hypothetical protein